MLVLASGACSGCTKDGAPNRGGQAASGTGGGGSDGLGGSAGGGASSGATSGGMDIGGEAPVTKYQACVQYLNAQCNRSYFECSGFEAKADPCPEYLALCPDFLFSEGSQLDVPSVLACAERWRTYSCELLSQGFALDCGLAPGTRALGEPCYNGRQCESMVCGRGNDAAHPDCGACVPVGKLGDPCDDGSFGCPNGYECTGDGCQPSYISNLPDGSLCERYGQCYGDSLCFFAPDGMMRCQPRRKLGEDCSGAYCEVGLLCGTDSRCAAPGPPAAVGELCFPNGCAADAWCHGNALPAAEWVCVPSAAAGQPCLKHEGVNDLIGNCPKGLFCQCEGSGCAPTCLAMKHEGEACGDALSYCIAGTRCEAGKCVGVELQGLAAAACGQ